MSQVVTETEANNPLVIRLQNGQVLHVKSNEATDADEIPVIDVDGIYSEKLEDRQAVADKIREAAHRIGFFYVVNHRFDPKLAEDVFEQAKRFFALPLENKLEVDTNLVPKEYVGYHAMSSYNRNGRKHKDLSEAFNLAYSAEQDPENPENDAGTSIWPSDLPGFREGLYAYHTPMLSFARKMTRIFALALHLPETYFDEWAKTPEAGMRILHYPEQEATVDDQNGIGAHTDFECFTIVNQDMSGGLEVLSKSGRWIRANPVPNSFVINIADCFMRQTNDYFVSTVHRVINKSGHERYSIPFFYGLDRRMIMEPIPSCISEDNPSKYPVMTAGEYYLWRAKKAKQGDKGDE
ncbi:putative gibberellin 3-beta hydroxylase [Exophiala viscosa]|uniref:putative gibberellin 3-beta hydroxylase n=1 Tax=Exophiala viscosa TaxID=2486360 RepID=UPI00218F5499|nr:putative gibberellin 3-beta hydroxylase [Exophiala viscosa]